MYNLQTIYMSCKTSIETTNKSIEMNLHILEIRILVILTIKLKFVFISLKINESLMSKFNWVSIHKPQGQTIV